MPVDKQQSCSRQQAMFGTFGPVVGMGYSKLNIHSLPQDQIASHDRNLPDVCLEMGIQSVPLKDASFNIKPSSSHGTWPYNFCLINS